MASLMDLMRALTGEVSSQHVQSRSKSNHFNINLLSDIAVMLSHVAYVVEGEIHDGGVIDVDLHGHSMRQLLVGGRSDPGRSTEFGGDADLRARHQGEHGGHASENDK